MIKSSFRLFVVAAVLAEFDAVAGEWSVLWKDDFNGSSGSQPDQWIYDLGSDWGMGQSDKDTRDPDNVSVDGHGNLLITPLRDSLGNWTSARIETVREDFRPPPGGKMAMEGRIQIPNVKGNDALGYWSAFWAKGSTSRHGVKWPLAGEVDVLETVNGLNRVWGTLHCGIAKGGPCQEPKGLSKNRPCPGKSCEEDFHVYRFEWDESVLPKEMRWYVDGQEYNKVTSDMLDETTWNAMTDNTGYYILLDVAMGGGLPDGVAGKKTPTTTTVPGHPMIIDYIAVYISE